MAFIYKMVQIPPGITIDAKNAKDQEAAIYLENVVNRFAKDGWEFYRIDSITVEKQVGCLAALFGARTSVISYYVITFRRSV